MKLRKRSIRETLTRMRLKSISLQRKLALDTILKSLGWFLLFVTVLSVISSGLSGRADKDAVVIAGLLVAFAGQLFTQAKAISDSRKDESKFYMDSCIRANEEAIDLLQDGNNERRQWIAAERALIIAEKLAGKVTASSHRQVLELYAMKHRAKFHSFITGKPAPF